MDYLFVHLVFPSPKNIAKGIWGRKCSVTFTACKSHTGHIESAPQFTVTLSLVPTMWEFSAFSWSHKAGTIDV